MEMVDQEAKSGGGGGEAAVEALVVESAKSDPSTEQCFLSEVARTRGNACYGDGDFAGALREWSAAVELSGELRAAAESKAMALSNRSMIKLSYFADVAGAVADAKASVLRGTHLFNGTSL